MSENLVENGLSGFSRVMLPKHTERGISHFKAQQKMVRPSLDSQQLEYITSCIVRSLLDKMPITIVAFDILDYEKEMTGVVVTLDQQLQCVKIQSNEGLECVPFYDVLTVRL